MSWIMIIRQQPDWLVEVMVKSNWRLRVKATESRTRGGGVSVKWKAPPPPLWIGSVLLIPDVGCSLLTSLSQWWTCVRYLRPPLHSVLNELLRKTLSVSFSCKVLTLVQISKSGSSVSPPNLCKVPPDLQEPPGCQFLDLTDLVCPGLDSLRPKQQNETSDRTSRPRWSFGRVWPEYFTDNMWLSSWTWISSVRQLSSHHRQEDSFNWSHRTKLQILLQETSWSWVVAAVSRPLTRLLCKWKEF